MTNREMRANIVVGGIVATIVLLAVGIFIQTAINDTNDRQDSAISNSDRTIRESQYRACIINGNTLRNQVRREFVDLKRKVLIPTFAGVAATIPEGSESKAILDAQVAYLHQRIRTIKDRIPDVDCMAIYPPLPGQTYPTVKEIRRGPDGLRPNLKGGGKSSTGSSPSSPPAPAGGGGNNGGSQGTNNPPNPPVGNPPTNPPPGNPPASPPGPLNPVTDPLGVDCHVSVAGVTLCN